MTTTYLPRNSNTSDEISSRPLQPDTVLSAAPSISSPAYSSLNKDINALIKPAPKGTWNRLSRQHTRSISWTNDRDLPHPTDQSLSQSLTQPFSSNSSSSSSLSSSSSVCSLASRTSLSDKSFDNQHYIDERDMSGTAARLTPDQPSSTQRAQNRHSSCILSQTMECSQYVDTRSFCIRNKSTNQLSRHNTHSRSHSMKLQSDYSTNVGSCCNGSGSPSGNNITQSNYKTEFCTTFWEFGSCPFGDRCQFVHHEHELQRRSRTLTYKTRLCWSGTDCPYQQNRARCIYLHGDETAEMFDQQRGVSFVRVQKILANKEFKQNRQRHHPKTTAATSGEFSTIGTGASESVWSYYPYGSRFAKSMDSIPGLASTFSSTQLNTTTTATAITTIISTITAPTKTLQTPKSLTIIPALPFSSLNEPAPLADTESTLQTIPDLFSPGVMPAIEIPFSSHDLINEWKDPCFEEEDSNMRHQTEGQQQQHRHLHSKPMTALLEHECLDTIVTKVDVKVISECEPRQQGNLQAQPQKFYQGQPALGTTSKNHVESTGLFSGIKARKNSMAFASQLSFALRWSSSSGARTSSLTASSGHSGSHYKLW